tara:strand:- start:758 stop:2533 length:1776 start_codon:yes stop_codon:yes gene_type:complete
MEARSYNSLAQRLNAFSQQAFGVAEQRAKTAGEIYGIENAPTLEQVESAKQLGQPVEVPGDATSGRVFDQAAYAGSMAVVESRYATAAQKAMTDIFVAADADATITPQEVQMQMQAAVTEYTKSLGMVDAASAAKLTNKLGIMANSKYIEFSRSYANRMQKQMVDGALVAADDHLEKVLPSLITGYNATTAQVPLDVSIRSDRANLEASLETQGVGVVARDKILDRYDKLVIDNKINAIVRLSDDATGTDPQADVMEMIKRLKKGNLADRSRQEIFDSLTPEQKRKSLGDLFSAGTAMKKQLGDDDDAKKAAQIELYNKFQNEVWSKDPDYEDLKKRILASGLLPKGDYGKDSLLSRINQMENAKKTDAASTGPTFPQKSEFRDFKRRIFLPSNDPRRLTAEKIANLDITILPVSGNQGVNLTTLRNLAKEDQTADENALKNLKEILLRQVKAAVGLREYGPKNQAADMLYADAVADLERLVQSEIEFGNMDKLLEDPLFKNGSERQRAFISYYKGQTQGLEQRLENIEEKLVGSPPVAPNNVPFKEFETNLRVFGRDYKKIAKYLSGRNVLDRTVTEQQAKEFYEAVYGP